MTSESGLLGYFVAGFSGMKNRTETVCTHHPFRIARANLRWTGRAIEHACNAGKAWPLSSRTLKRRACHLRTRGFPYDALATRGLLTRHPQVGKIILRVEREPRRLLLCCI
jgi:hypothetical protein